MCHKDLLVIVISLALATLKPHAAAGYVAPQAVVSIVPIDTDLSAIFIYNMFYPCVVNFYLYVKRWLKLCALKPTVLY